MNPNAEICIDLTAQELTDPSTVAPIEVDDICEFDPLLQPVPAANNDGAVLAPNDPKADPALDDDTIEVEIELSADQIDAVLSGLDIKSGGRPSQGPAPLRVVGKGRQIFFRVGVSWIGVAGKTAGDGAITCWVGPDTAASAR